MLRVNGFHGHIKRNDLRSATMFLGFVVALQLIAAVALALPLLFLDLQHSPLFPLAYMARYAPAVLVASAGLFVFKYRNHVASVRGSVDFPYVDRASDSRLVNTVETLAIAAGLPLPKVGLIETSARNAFACGLGASSAVVVVTRGFLEALDDDELSAVVAHEISHIANGDIRLMAAANVLMDIVMRLRRRNVLQIGGWKRGLLAVFFTPYLLAAMASGFAANVGLIVARLSRLLIAASREFVADAEAVRLTQMPEALISALRKIDGRSTLAGLDPQADAMMIDGATTGAFATHPTIAERIATLTRLSTISVAEPAMFAASAVPEMTATGQLDIASWRRHLARQASQQPAKAAATGLGDRLSVLARTDIKVPAFIGAPGRLVDRVNGDVKGNLCGISPGARRGMKGAVCVLVSLQLVAIFQGQRERRAWESAHAGEFEAARQSQATIDRLSASDPVVARCFATDYYDVEDGAAQRFHAPRPELVEAYANGAMGKSWDVELERFLGYRVSSLRAWDGGRPVTGDRALTEYVKTRKIVVELAYRTYGDLGLGAAQAAYDTPLDRRVMVALRERRRDAAIGGSDAALVRDIDLLTGAPGDFIPCPAREASNRKLGAS